MHGFACSHCIIVCFSPMELMNASYVGFQSQVIWEPDTQMAAIKVKALDMWTSSFKVLANWFLLLERTKGKLRKVPTRFGGSGRSAVISCMLIKTLTLRQQLAKYAVKLFYGKDWEMSMFVCSLCTEPWRLQPQLSACMPVTELVLCLPQSCGTQRCKPHWLSELRCFGGPSLQGGVLKLETVVCGPNLSSSGRSQEFEIHSYLYGTVLGAGFYGQCLSLSYLFQ